MLGERKESIMEISIQEMRTSLIMLSQALKLTLVPVLRSLKET